MHSGKKQCNFKISSCDWWFVVISITMQLNNPTLCFWHKNEKSCLLHDLSWAKTTKTKRISKKIIIPTDGVLNTASAVVSFTQRITKRSLKLSSNFSRSVVLVFGLKSARTRMWRVPYNTESKNSWKCQDSKIYYIIFMNRD